MQNESLFFAAAIRWLPHTIHWLVRFAGHTLSSLPYLNRQDRLRRPACHSYPRRIILWYQTFQCDFNHVATAPRVSMPSASAARSPRRPDNPIHLRSIGRRDGRDAQSQTREMRLGLFAHAGIILLDSFSLFVALLSDHRKNTSCRSTTSPSLH